MMVRRSRRGRFESRAGRGSRKQEAGSRKQGRTRATRVKCFKVSRRDTHHSCFLLPASCFLEESWIHHVIENRSEGIGEPKECIVLVAREERPAPEEYVSLVTLSFRQIHLVVDPAVTPAKSHAEPAEQAHTQVARQFRAPFAHVVQVAAVLEPDVAVAPWLACSVFSGSDINGDRKSVV